MIFKKKKDVVVKAFKLKLFPNLSKKEIALYALNRFELYCNHFIGKAFFEKKPRSTKDMGWLPNKAQHYCRNEALKIKKSARTTGNKVNVPVIRPYSVEMPVAMERAKGTDFDFWVKIPNQWTKKKTVQIPVRSHKALNKALKNGWKFTNFVSLKRFKDGIQIIVFVEKQRPITLIPADCIGVDVGLKRAISTSDGFRGKDIRPLIRSEKIKHSERQRQRIKYKQEIPLKGKTNKTKIKQQINRYAQSLIRRSKKLGTGIAVESSRALSNLKSGSLQGWARCAFTERVQILGKEEGVFVVEVNPWRTSKLCPDCRTVGERNGIVFKCLNKKCKMIEIQQDADLVGSKNIRFEGRVTLEKIILSKSGTQTSAVVESWNH
ncbi:MAG: zinc ribbon domain-containing protein [Bacteriovoracales bacterium]